MKALVAVLAFIFLASPALARECSAKPSPSAHYRLIDGKRCWYKGTHLAKSDLTWSRSNATANSVLPSRVDDIGTRADHSLASVDREALCGEVSWGFCSPDFADRWRVR
jgi:hypothetical protein